MKNTIKKLIAIALVGLQLSVTTLAVAAEPDVGSVMAPLKKSAPAPFTGVLLSPQAIANIIADKESLPEKITIEVNKAREEERAQGGFKVSEEKTISQADKAVLQAQLDARMKEITNLEASLKKEQANRANVPLWTALGFGGGIVVTLLTVYVVSKATAN